jgi:putative aminopeptidase FrvX
MEETFISVAERLMRCPAAPYHEEAVATEAIRICDEHGLSWKLDRYGNTIVELNPRSRSRPFVLAAHLDHPGFVFRKKLDPLTWRAEFLGGVGERWFRQGTKLRVMPGWISATLGNQHASKQFQIHLSSIPEEQPRFAVWDLTAFKSKGDRITGRACDDLIGAAAILSTLIELRRLRSRRRVIGVLSRGEEVGFHGALALAGSDHLPKNSIVISLETSRELPPVKMGQGVIIRVGDRASVFDAEATRYLTEVGGELEKRDNSFKFQRALMSGGTCEGTAYQEYGFQCAAVCVALGNYHNCGSHHKIRAEFVSRTDGLAMVKLLVEAADKLPRFRAITGRLRQRMAKYAREGRRNLSSSFTISTKSGALAKK